MQATGNRSGERVDRSRSDEWSTPFPRSSLQKRVKGEEWTVSFLDGPGERQVVGKGEV